MAELRKANTTESHQSNLKEAIYYLPHEMDKKILYKALKTIYGDVEGKEMVTEWFYKAQIPRFQHTLKKIGIQSHSLPINNRT